MWSQLQVPMSCRFSGLCFPMCFPFCLSWYWQNAKASRPAAGSAQKLPSPLPGRKQKRNAINSGAANQCDNSLNTPLSCILFPEAAALQSSGSFIDFIAENRLTSSYKPSRGNREILAIQSFPPFLLKYCHISFQVLIVSMGVKKASHGSKQLRSKMLLRAKVLAAFIFCIRQSNCPKLGVGGNGIIILFFSILW